MKKWEKIEIQRLSKYFCSDFNHKLTDKDYFFENYSISFLLNFKLKDNIEYWLFYVELIYKIYKCNMIETITGYKKIN